MTLSDGEKLIIIMLCDIHKALNLKGAVDADFVSSSIANGHLKELKWETQGISRSPQDKAGPAAEVGDILDMWSAIERGYKRLTAEEKRQVEAEAGPLGRGVRFSGFDDDRESEHREAAYLLIEKMGKFERFQGRNLSSHMPSLDGYRRMMRVFASMRPPVGDARLDVRQIIDLANAEKHPG
jgi:uncharacterized protein YfbU (UPF0304 family)